MPRPFSVLAVEAITVWFWSVLALTVLVLAGAVVTGLRHRRRLHLTLALSSLPLLVLAVLLAEAMARARVFPPAEMAVHLGFARSAAALVLPVVASGAWLWRTGRARRVHLACVVAFLVAVVAATGTGVWVFSLSVPRE